jgi:phosphoserine phosphatase RsbU/P
MTNLGELRVEAATENMRMLSYFLHGVSDRLQLTGKMLFDVELALEEAVANIINHAYPAQAAGHIVLRAEATTEMLSLTLIDWGREFDMHSVLPFDHSASIEMRISGGMGLHFIKTLMDRVDYQTSPLGEPNTLTLEKKIERLQPGLHHPSAARELNAMLNVSRIVSTIVDIDRLLERIVNVLVDTIEAERGTLYLVEQARLELISNVLNEDALQEIRIKIGEGIAGQVAATGRVMNIRDPYAHPKFDPTFDKLSGFRSRSILAAPLVNNQREIIGVVQLLNKKSGDFSSRDERLLTALASQAAISIENARLYEGAMRQKLIEKDLETGRSIQESFLPQSLPEHASWDISAFWLPMREVGGDFYDFHFLPDGRLAVVIADVSGKGVPAALFMAMCVTVLRFAISVDFSPAQLMRRVNELILVDQRSRMFATAFVGYVDLENGAMQYASGGHNPPLIYRAGLDAFEYLRVAGVAIGAFPTAHYDESETRLAPEDVLILYTDGITEVIDADEQEFGLTRLESLVRENATATAEEISNHIIEAVTAHSHDNQVYDDETLIVIKRLA